MGKGGTKYRRHMEEQNAEEVGGGTYKTHRRDKNILSRRIGKQQEQEDGRRDEQQFDAQAKKIEEEEETTKNIPRRIWGYPCLFLRVSPCVVSVL